jgi:phosphatidylserine/phosphatidylglycerophosphate/cardiolipin synthase-like enzyme
MPLKQTNIAGGAIKAAFVVQEGVADAHERVFTAGQLGQAAKIGDTLASFISAARSSIHMAIYDFRLDGAAATAVIGALDDAARAGRDVRIAYFEAPKQPTPANFALLGSDPAVVNDGLGGAAFHAAVKTRGIRENPAESVLVPPVVGEPIIPPHNLMHSKYIVRDGLTSEAGLLMGSANFTTDAWSVQDNNILIFEKCHELSAYYENDFSEMWQSGVISNSGNFDTADVNVGDTPVRVMFAPGRGRQIGAEIAARIDAAKKRLFVASMVVSSGPIMGAIIDRMHRVDKFAGIFDGSEMRMVMREWGRSKANSGGPAPASRRAAASTGKLQQFQEIAAFLHYKKSLPFNDHGVHNFMHNKFAVVDDAVITGSFNFSANAQANAENVVIIESRELLDAYSDYAETLIGTYPDTGTP